MKINEIKKCGFYLATNSDYFLIEVTKLSQIDVVESNEDLSDYEDSLFVDLWYHDPKKPYFHKKGVYQSNGRLYKINTIPDIFMNLDLVEDNSSEYINYGKEGKMLYRRQKRLLA